MSALCCLWLPFTTLLRPIIWSNAAKRFDLAENIPPNRISNDMRDAAPLPSARFLDYDIPTSADFGSELLMNTCSWSRGLIGCLLWHIANHNVLVRFILNQSRMKLILQSRSIGTEYWLTFPRWSITKMIYESYMSFCVHAHLFMSTTHAHMFTCTSVHFYVCIYLHMYCLYLRM